MLRLLVASGFTNNHRYFVKLLLCKEFRSKVQAAMKWNEMERMGADFLDMG